MRTEQEKREWREHLAAQCAAIRARIEGAGIKYPDMWAEWGSSERDLWEDRIIRRLDRAAARAAQLEGKTA